MTKQQRHMVSIVRAIAAGKWTDELPDWAMRAWLQNTRRNENDLKRAIQTCEALILLQLDGETPFNEREFIIACGFRP